MLFPDLPSSCDGGQVALVRQKCLCEHVLANREEGGSAMGMADDIGKRLASENAQRQAQQHTAKANLRQLERHLDVLAPEFAQGAKQLKIKQNTRNMFLRGW